MLTIRSTKCPWAFVGVAGALVVLVTAVHVFMVPILPSSLDFFGARRAVDRPRNVLPEARVVDSRLKGRFPADSYGAVTYRGAPWKSEIGRWLAGCHAGSSAVNVTEVCTKLCHCSLFSDLVLLRVNFVLLPGQVIGTKRCDKDCSGHGVCNYDLGECRCFHGYAG